MRRFDPRSEVARAAATLVEASAEHIRNGSPGTYVAYRLTDEVNSERWEVTVHLHEPKPKRPKLKVVK
jgi:hypothetical protein